MMLTGATQWAPYRMKRQSPPSSGPKTGSRLSGSRWSRRTKFEAATVLHRTCQQDGGDHREFAASFYRPQRGDAQRDSHPLGASEAARLGVGRTQGLSADPREGGPPQVPCHLSKGPRRS